MKHFFIFCIAVFAFQAHAARLCLFPKLPRNYLPVPIRLQAYDYTCGPAALLSVLYYWKKIKEGGESILYERLQPDEKEGVTITQLANAAKAYHLKAVFKENLNFDDLRTSLNRGETVILALQAWPDPPNRQSKHRRSLKYWRNLWKEGHYVVLVGMDEDFAYCMDPSTPDYYTYLPLDELDARWHEEETRGSIWRYQHGGVIIRGKKPIKWIQPHRLIRLR